jgi:small subunit ribosomal protein S9
MTKRKGKKGITTKSKKKTAVARATIKKGTGKIRINKKPITSISPKALQELVKEPITLAEEKANTTDINVTVKGGGHVSQAMAARGAIAKALTEYGKNETLKKKMLAYDRLLLVDDARRVETKKPLGKKARRKKQKSKR